MGFGIVLVPKSAHIARILSSRNSHFLSVAGVEVGDEAVAVNKSFGNRAQVISALQLAKNDADVTFRKPNGRMITVKLERHGDDSEKRQSASLRGGSETEETAELLLDNFKACLDAAATLMDKSIQSSKPPNGSSNHKNKTLLYDSPFSPHPATNLSVLSSKSTLEEKTLEISDCLEAKAVLQQFEGMERQIAELEEQLEAQEAESTSEIVQLRHLLHETEKRLRSAESENILARGVSPKVSKYQGGQSASPFTPESSVTAPHVSNPIPFI